MIGLDNGLWLVIGAIAAFIGLQTRARPLVRLIPIAALGLLSLDFSGLASVELAAFVRPTLVGAGLAVLVLGRN